MIFCNEGDLVEHQGNLFWQSCGSDYSSEDLEAMKRVFSGCPTIHLKKHEYLFRNGDIIHNICFIKSGRLMQCMYLPNGKRRIISFHNTNTIIGAVAAFSGIPSTNDCEAYFDCTLVKCSADLFLKRLIEYDLIEMFIRKEQRKSYRMQLRLGMLSEQCDMEMVSELLKEHLTQQEIGDFLGVSRVHVARICRMLREAEGKKP